MYNNEDLKRIAELAEQIASEKFFTEEGKRNMSDLLQWAATASKEQVYLMCGMMLAENER